MDNPIAIKGATEFYYLLSGTENLDDKLPENKKSIAFRVLLQPQDKTFNDQEIEELSNKIIDEISKSLDASIRN